MSLDYIRKTYGVPAKRGGRVEYTDPAGRKVLGTITSARDARLNIRMDGCTHAGGPFHPTWNLRYLPAQESIDPGGGAPPVIASNNTAQQK